jgi:hypothetical protein
MKKRTCYGSTQKNKETWYLTDGAKHRVKTWYLMDGAEHRVKTWYLMDGVEHSQKIKLYN